jgi:hypothetical protein
VWRRSPVSERHIGTDEQMERLRRRWLIIAGVVVLVGIAAAALIIWALAVGTAPEPRPSPS